MTTTDLATFRDFLIAKRAELAKNAPGLESITIERSADEIEEAQYEISREIVIARINSESSVRRSVAAALRRIQNGTFGTCAHCNSEIVRRRLEAVPWTALCIRCQEAADIGEESIVNSFDPAMLDAA
jgi:DnaK suppressor protein